MQLWLGKNETHVVRLQLQPVAKLAGEGKKIAHAGIHELDRKSEGKKELQMEGGGERSRTKESGA